MFGLYIGIFQLVYLSEPEEAPITTEEKEEEPAPLIAEATADEIIKPETQEIDPDADCLSVNRIFVLKEFIVIELSPTKFCSIHDSISRITELLLSIPIEIGFIVAMSV